MAMRRRLTAALRDRQRHGSGPLRSRRVAHWNVRCGWPKGMSRCCRCPPLRQQRRTNARAWYTISGAARTFSPLKYPSGSAVELHLEEDGWLAAWAGLEPARDLFLHAVKPGGGLEPRTFALRGLWLYLAGGRFDSG